MLFNPYLEEFKKNPPCNFKQYLGDIEAFILASAACRLTMCEYIAKYSFAVPTLEALLAIETYTNRIFEAGAGTGYWAYLLEQRGCDVYACDTAPGENSWTTVHREDAVEAIGKGKADGRTLLISWPGVYTSFALDCLEAYTGDTFIYIGDWRWFCGTEGFFQLLEKDWEKLVEVDLPQYPNCRDKLYIFKKIRWAKG